MPTDIDESRIFSALSNPIRLRCLYLLARCGEICVCELVEALEINQPLASKAVASLKTAGLVSDRRDANWIYYRINPDLADWHRTIIDATVERLRRCPTSSADEKKLRQLLNRPAGSACPPAGRFSTGR